MYYSSFGRKYLTFVNYTFVLKLKNLTFVLRDANHQPNGNFIYNTNIQERKQTKLYKLLRKVIKTRIGEEYTDSEKQNRLRQLILKKWKKTV